MINVPFAQTTVKKLLHHTASLVFLSERHKCSPYTLQIRYVPAQYRILEMFSILQIMLANVSTEYYNVERQVKKPCLKYN